MSHQVAWRDLADIVRAHYSVYQSRLSFGDHITVTMPLSQYRSKKILYLLDSSHSADEQFFSLCLHAILDIYFRTLNGC